MSDTLLDLDAAAREAEADAEYDREDAETRRETPRTPWSVRLLPAVVEILDADGAPIQWMKRSPKTEACAELIVEAVNWYTDRTLTTPPSLERIKVTLRGPGVPPLEVNGWAIVGKPGLAVTLAHGTEDNDQPWRMLLGEFFVTHTPSGYRLGLYPVLQDDAIQAMQALHALGLDWTKPQDAFTPDEKACARAVLRQFGML